jgi:hypothetical protein
MGIAFIVVAAALFGTGLFYMYYWLVVAGLLNLVFGLVLLVVPAVVISERKVSLRNLFGQSAVEYPHDSIASLRIHEDTLMIRHKDRQALVKRIRRPRFHPADWRGLQARLLATAPRSASKP